MFGQLLGVGQQIFGQEDRDNIVAEYALRGVGKPIGVSRYALAASLPEDLRGSLPTIAEVEAGLSEAESESDDEDEET
jgi:hypothetical protein